MHSRASLTDPHAARVLEPVFEHRRKVSRQRSLSNPDMSDMQRLSDAVYVRCAEPAVIGSAVHTDR